MKKVKKIIIVFLMSIILMPHQNVFALSGNISISGKTTLAPGESATYTITFNSTDTSFFSYEITGANLTLSGDLSSGAYGSGEKKSESVTITAKAISADVNTSISVVGSMASTIDGTETAMGAAGMSKSLSISVKTPAPTPTPNPTKPAPTKPPVQAPPKLDNTEDDKAGSTVSPEELAKQEEARKAQELEALKKIPLINSVEVISLSDKFQDEVLETIKSNDNVFEYSYTLPKRIEEFSLKVDAPEDVNLTYDETHKFEEEEENEKTIIIKASKGEIDQSFNIVIKRNVFEVVEKTVFETPLSVYDDERLDSFIETIGAEKIDDTHFKFDDLLFQLVIDSDNNAKWLLLNEDLSDHSFGLIHLNEAGELLFILESDDLKDETLYGEKYSNKELIIDERIVLIDPSLNFETTYKGTSFEEGVIVYAMNSKGIEGNYFISDDSSFTYAAVAFDQVNMTYKYVAWFSSIALIALVGALVVTKILNRDKSFEEQS